MISIYLLLDWSIIVIKLKAKRLFRLSDCKDGPFESINQIIFYILQHTFGNNE